MVIRFPPKKHAGCPEASRDFPPRKDGILHAQSGCLGTPLPSPRVCTGGRAYAYQICLAIVHRWRAPLIIMNLAFWWEQGKSIWVRTTQRQVGRKEGEVSVLQPRSHGPWLIAKDYGNQVVSFVILLFMVLHQLVRRWLIQMRRAWDRGDFIGFISGPIQSFSV